MKLSPYLEEVISSTNILYFKFVHHLKRGGLGVGGWGLGRGGGKWLDNMSYFSFSVVYFVCRK